jgi:hypothetical protein
MMNKKLIALLVAISAISSISAHYDNCYIDDNGIEQCPETRKHRLFGRECRDDERCYDPVRGTGQRVGETVKDAGRTAGDAANALTLGIFE